MIAERISILPPPTLQQAIETTKVYNGKIGLCRLDGADPRSRSPTG